MFACVALLCPHARSAKQFVASVASRRYLTYTAAPLHVTIWEETTGSEQAVEESKLARLVSMMTWPSAERCDERRRAI